MAKKKTSSAGRKKATVRKTTKKKPAAKKKAPAKKKAAKKAPARKKAVKKAPGKKKAAKKAPAKKKAAPKEAVKPAKPKKRRKGFTAKQLKEFKEVLQALRDRVVDEISFLAGDNLNRSQRDSSGDLSSYSFHMADQGTDNFDREFALNLVSSEQDVLYEIDEAIGRIEMGDYGVCEGCGKMIERPRLQALPFAKMCIECKSAAEKGKSRYRPFGPTISRTG